MESRSKFKVFLQRFICSCSACQNETDISKCMSRNQWWAFVCVCVCVCARARACACARARFHESPGTCNGKRIRCVFLTSPWLHYKLIFGNWKTPCRPPVTQFKALIVVGYFRDELCGIKTSHVAETWDLVREMCYQLKGFPYLKTVRFDYYRNPLRTKPTWRVKLFVILF